MVTAAGVEAANTGRIVDVMVVDHASLEGEQFYLVLRVSYQDGSNGTICDPKCRYHNVMQADDGGAVVGFGELGWISASAVRTVGRVEYVERQITRIDATGAHRIAAPQPPTSIASMPRPGLGC